MPIEVRFFPRVEQALQKFGDVLSIEHIALSLQMYKEVLPRFGIVEHLVFIKVQTPKNLVVELLVM